MPTKKQIPKIVADPKVENFAEFLHVLEALYATKIAFILQTSKHSEKPSLFFDKANYKAAQDLFPEYFKLEKIPALGTTTYFVILSEEAPIGKHYRRWKCAKCGEIVTDRKPFRYTAKIEPPLTVFVGESEITGYLCSKCAKDVTKGKVSNVSIAFQVLSGAPDKKEK